MPLLNTDEWSAIMSRESSFSGWQLIFWVTPHSARTISWIINKRLSAETCIQDIHQDWPREGEWSRLFFWAGKSTRFAGIWWLSYQRTPTAMGVSIERWMTCIDTDTGCLQQWRTTHLSVLSVAKQRAYTACSTSNRVAVLTFRPLTGCNFRCCQYLR
jgi:hypothetical protein